MLKKIKIKNIRKLLLTTLLTIMFPISIINFIYGGETVQVDEKGREIPQGIFFHKKNPPITWFASVKENGKLKASGILLTPKLVLTAFHALENLVIWKKIENDSINDSINDYVIVGEDYTIKISVNIGKVNGRYIQLNQTEDINVERFYFYSDLLSENKLYDIAILELEKPASMPPFMNTSNYRIDWNKILKDSDLHENLDLILFGMGLNENDELPQELKKINYKIPSKFELKQELYKYFETDTFKHYPDFKHLYNKEINSEGAEIIGELNEEGKKEINTYLNFKYDKKFDNPDPLIISSDGWGRPGDSGGPVMLKYKKKKTVPKPDGELQPEAKIDTSSNSQPSTSQEQNKKPQEEVTAEKEAQQEKVVKQNPSEEEWEWDYKLVGIYGGEIYRDVINFKSEEFQSKGLKVISYFICFDTRIIYWIQGLMLQLQRKD